MSLLDLREVSKRYHEQLKKVKVMIFDVDGICTNGKLYWSGDEVGFNRQFHTHDGYGLKIMKNAGIHVGIISGGNSVGVQKRFEGLGLDLIYLGNEDKRASFIDLLSKTGCDASEALYMGDEFFDLPVMKMAGFSVTVPNASIEIREAADYVTIRPSGEACVREIIDMVRHVQGIVPQIEY